MIKASKEKRLAGKFSAQAADELVQRHLTSNTNANAYSVVINTRSDVIGSPATSKVDDVGAGDRSADH
jgi:hypothetical protein